VAIRRLPTTWQPPVFLLNSRLGRFSAAPFRSDPRRIPTYSGHPFSRCYGVILPSSFSRNHSSTLGFSPRLPVSVCGTVGVRTPARGFSRRPASRTLASAHGLHSGSGLTSNPADLPTGPSYAVPSDRSTTRRSFCFRVPPCGQTHELRHGNVDPFPIAYASRPRLRGRLTRSG